ncbi:MAG: outer membrane protein [Hyphomicrobiaceae bacterium]
MGRTRNEIQDSAASFFSLPGWSSISGQGVPHLLTLKTVCADVISRHGGWQTEWRYGRGIEAMKCKLASLSLGLAVVMVGNMPAFAGDWNHGAGGLKDYASAAVPVPAPMPIPVFESNYYFRADFGIGTAEEPNTVYSGTPYGTDRPAGPFGLLGSWEDNEYGHYPSYGIGVGYHFGNGLRMDLTAETKASNDLRREGALSYTNFTGDRVTVRARDEITTGGGVFMLNGYYDFKRAISQSLTPYLGVGLGFAWNTFDRENRSTTVNRTTGTTISDESYEDKSSTVSLAAMASVGAAYEMTDGWYLDMNYRYLFIDGSDGATIEISGEPSELSLGSTSIHQIRAGVRVDLD